MPASTGSLEPLSSPSPSPSPPPINDKHTVSKKPTSTSNNSTSAAGAGLDSGSELSELTEDEQENIHSTSKSKGSRGKDSQEKIQPARRGRKRGGIVPAPMWDWAYKEKSRKDWKTRAAVEEEEEEEQTGPARAMEEEEDEDVDDDERSDESEGAEDREDDAGDDEEPEEGDEDDEPLGIIRKSTTRDSTNSDDEGENGDGVDRVDVRTKVLHENKSDDENMDEDTPQRNEDHPTPKNSVRGARKNVVESEEDTPPAKSTSVTPTSKPIACKPSITTPDASTSMPFALTGGEATPMELDAVEAAPPQIMPIIAAAAASSIMTGSAVVNPPSPSPSSSFASGSPRVSPASSRSPSPDVLSDREPEPKRTSKPKSKAKSTRTSRTNPRSRRRTAGTKSELVGGGLDDVDGVNGDVDEKDGGDMDDLDIDSPDMELEAELQPAHRAEALDVLATIELKFALLRERLYVEKMDGLAWEEALVNEGNHPEMLHLHAELSKRRDKRLELATRRRDYEIANTTKRRKLDEDEVWSWWRWQRDQLQTEMISETNRKRRKLDRERRALDRPQPVRRIPPPPPEVPPPQTLRDIIKSYPFGTSETHPNKRRPFSPPTTTVPLAYPQLGSLPPVEVANDIDFLIQHRHVAGLEAARGNMIPMGGPTAMPGLLPGQMVNGFEQFGMIVDGPPGMPNPGRFLSHMAFPPQQQLHGAMLPPFPPGPGPASGQSGPPPPRLQHHHSAPPGQIPNLSMSAHQQMLIEQELASVHQPPSRATHPSQNGVSFPNSNVVNLMRRSISPVPLPGIGPGPGQSSKSQESWPGPILPPSSKEKRHGGGGPKPMDIDLPERDRRIEREALSAREREKERNRDREFDQRDRIPEREQDRERQGQNHVHTVARHQHSYPHTHASAGAGSHVHPAGHHHHHHHHHVRHHHHPNTSGQSPEGSGPPIGSGLALPMPVSPRNVREVELRDLQRLPLPSSLELLEQHMHSTKQGTPSQPPMPAYWKSKDEPRPPHLGTSDFLRDRDLRERDQREREGVRERERVRARGEPIAGSSGQLPPERPERMMPMGLHPSQTAQGPHATFSPPVSTSVPSSRRGSFSGPSDDREGGIPPLPRPSSASSRMPNTILAGPSRLPPISANRPQVSPTMPDIRNPPMPSPRSNGIRLPPLGSSSGPLNRLSHPLAVRPGSPPLGLFSSSTLPSSRISSVGPESNLTSPSKLTAVPVDSSAP